MNNKNEIDKKKYTNDLRLIILDNSLFHEYLITKSLGDILDFEIENSYSLSDKSSALSLASKINLLIDLKSITKEQKPKLFYYLEIRNQFLHNWTCKTFEDCFKSLDKTYNALKKLYRPDTNSTLEEQMMYCYNSLSNDIVDIAINHLTMNVIKVKTKRVTQEKDLKIFENMRTKVIEDFWEILNSEIVSKYDITFEDKRKMMVNFMDTVI